MCAQSQAASGYSRIEHVAQAIFFDQWETRYMAMFTVYFDCSGHPNDTNVLSVAGFVANSGQWIRFEKEWKKVLAVFGVSSLHMKNFAHSTGEFASWKGDETKRRAFLASLIRVLKKRARHSFVSSVYLPDYREIDAVHHIRKVRSPLAMAGCSCIQKVQNWALGNKFELSEMVYVFEDGDADKSNLFQAAEHDLGVHPIFMKKEQSSAFQAADLLAYEHLKAVLKVVPASGVYALEELRQPLQKLTAIPHGIDGEDWGVQARPELERTLAELLPRLGLPWP